MIGRGLLLLFTLTSSLVVFGQNTMIPWKGLYIIQDGQIKEGDCIFCNPETMPDRIVLDSSKKMIAKRTGNPLGYTYYEWKNKAYTKTYEEIQIRPLKYRSTTYYTDSGQVRPPEKNTFNGGWHFYFRFPTNTKQRYNGLWIAEKIRVELSKQATDSLLASHKYLKGKLLIGTKFWTELTFYENGKLQSSGTLITGLKESSQGSKDKELTDQLNTPENQFRIGLWTYYDANGQLNNQETITTIRKVK
jgi:hypothetical protein